MNLQLITKNSQLETILNCTTYGLEHISVHIYEYTFGSRINGGS